ncbi:MAG TPA: DUF1573 domain-containing protein [Saprospirales bacterium]|nr:DUF1573 domain-containing protein [Saprospirales bacterium]HAY71959.1 DUF1573 domain-containing protein [Saprospirales bacterium]HRQ30824.1 DUF1573 domain-containing protein [Saprospiraceae bacterium]
MRNLLLIAFIATFIFVGFSSCKEDAVKEEARQELNTGTAQNAETRMPDAQPVMTPPEGATEEIAMGPVTTVEYEGEVHDFGKVMEGDIVTHVFKFKNTGDEPLILKDVKASCGCTAPSWSRTPIAPGKKGEIEVRFDTKGRGQAGGKPESKRITVTANTDPNPTYLTIKGLVDKKA